jgi:hypothetical protein
MPLLRQLLLSAIFTNLTYLHPYKWTRPPLPRPPLTRFHHWFISEWNMGLYPLPKHQRFRPILHSTFQSTNEPSHSQTRENISVPSVQSFNHHLDHNQQLLAYLYSLSTPAHDCMLHFGTDLERICIDTGASACISTRKENFVSIRQVDNLKINGIGSSLPVAGIGLLKWTIRDDTGNDIDLYVHDALLVPTAPMGLL